MATYTDDFNRANGNLSASANWSTPSYSDNELVIDGNAVFSGGGDDYGQWTGDGTWGRQQRSTITIGAIGGDYVSPVVYLTASGCYQIDARPSTGGYIFTKVDGSGNNTTMGAGKSFGGLSTGDEIGLEANDDGSGNTTLTTYLNGTLHETHTDTTSPYTSGSVGIHATAFERDSIDAWEGNDYAVAATDTVTATVTDQSGTALPNETGIDWHWTDSFSGSHTDSGSGETTDGSGVIVVDVPNTALTSGQFGYLTIKLSNGNVGIARESID